MIIIRCVLFILCITTSLAVGAQGGPALGIDSPYIGAWKGNWLEGMSSGNTTLVIAQSSGELTLTALPSFGSDPVSLSKINGSASLLGFHAVGADGRTMRFELKPYKDYKVLKGKAYYEGLHMELELRRVP